jgi:hypothetical protein
MTYLVVDDNDGRVVAEYEQLADAVRAIRAGGPSLRLVMFEDTGGAVARAESWITVRTR